MTNLTLDSYVTYWELCFSDKNTAFKAYAILVIKFKSLEIFYTLEDKDTAPRIVFKVRTYKVDWEDEREEFSEVWMKMYDSYIKNLKELSLIE